MNAGTPAISSGANPAQRKQRKKKAAPTNYSAAGPAKDPVIGPKVPKDEPSRRFQFITTQQPNAVRSYLETLYNADTENPVGVPMSLGDFEIATDIWRTKESGIFTIGSSGAGYVAVCASGTVEAANGDGTPSTDCQVLGYTTSSVAAVRSLDQFTNYDQITVSGAVLGPTLGGTVLDKPDAGFNATTRVRLVALNLTVSNTANPIDTQGEALFFMTTNPKTQVGGGGINGSYWDDIFKCTSRDMVTLTCTMTELTTTPQKIVWIPSEGQAFDMNLLSAVSPQNGFAPIFHLGCRVRGATQGAQLSYNITYIWESEVAKTNAVSMSDVRPYVAPGVAQHAAAMSIPHALHSNVPNVHMIPFMKTMADTDPQFAAALLDTPQYKSKGARARDKILVTRPHGSSSDIFAGIANVARGLLKETTKSGVLKLIPGIGNTLDKVASVVNGLLNF